MTNQNNMQDTPYTFDCWADPVVHLPPLKSSITVLFQLGKAISDLKSKIEDNSELKWDKEVQFWI